jgi:hypothetical protein
MQIDCAPIRKVKQGIQQLLYCTEDSSKSLLSQLSSDVVDLMEENALNDYMRLQVTILGGCSQLDSGIHAAIVVID